MFQIKLVKLLELTRSDNDHEALNAIRTANQILRKNDHTWSKLFNAGELVNFQLDKLRQARAHVMPFGKYKNCSLGHIAEKDFAYLQWLHGLGTTKSPLKQYLKLIVEDS